MVTHFVRIQGACRADPIPSAALLILRAAVYGCHEHWSLTRLGRTYAALTSFVLGAAIWTIAAQAPTDALPLLAVAVPLIKRDFCRFFISTYSEPAGLLAAVTTLAGAAILMSARPMRATERSLGILLTGSGGVLGVASKNAYAPLHLTAATICVRAAGRRGTAVAILASVISICSVIKAQRWQYRNYRGVNEHNLIFTLLIPELGPTAAVAVGLPSAAAEYAGHGSSDENGTPVDGCLVPGWQQVVAVDPIRARFAAFRCLIRHPHVLIRAIGIAIQATVGRDIDYLPDIPLPAGTSNPRIVGATGSMGHASDPFHEWLDSMEAPGAPAVLAGVGLTAGGICLLGWPSHDTCRTFLGIAGTSAASAIGIAAVAVIGDGYYELAKHVWLSAYLLDVTAASLDCAIAIAILRIWTWLREMEVGL